LKNGDKRLRGYCKRYNDTKKKQKIKLMRRRGGLRLFVSLIV